MPQTLQIKRNFTANQAPLSLRDGEFAVNLGNTPPVLFMGTGLGVVRVGPVTTSTTQPARPITGTIWLNGNDLKIYTSSNEWMELATPKILESYPRKDEDATITGSWNFTSSEGTSFTDITADNLAINTDGVITTPEIAVDTLNADTITTPNDITVNENIVYHEGNLPANTGIAETWESGELTVLASTQKSYVFSHNKNKRPFYFQVYGRCNAISFGYQIGDEVAVYGTDSTDNRENINMWADSNQIGMEARNRINVAYKNAPGSIGSLDGNWRVFARAMWIE